MKKVKSVSGLKVVFYYAGHVQPVASLLFWCQKRMGGRLTLSFCHAHTYPLHSEFGMCVCVNVHASGWSQCLSFCVFTYERVCLRVYI